MTDQAPDTGELTYTRVFDAPRELVFRCMLEPEHLTHFWGPAGVSTPLETIKIDPADHVLGQRINVWVSLILFLISAVAFWLLFRRRREAPGPASRQGRPGEPAAAVAGHAPTERPTAAIEARRRTQRRKKT